MNIESYECKTDPTFTSFSFESVGPNGVIKKVVSYQFMPGFLLAGLQVFNLAFGDWNRHTARIDDSVVSNNGDRDKVLATVAFTIFSFCDKNGNVPIFVKGSSPCRTRLYQMGISANKADVDRQFFVFGWLAGRWQPFKTGVNYDAFLIIRKKS